MSKNSSTSVSDLLLGKKNNKIKKVEIKQKTWRRSKIATLRVSYKQNLKKRMKEIKTQNNRKNFAP